MENSQNLIRQIFRNKIILFAVSRYATYTLQFINSILVAIYLGPHLLGIWGFLLLIIQYLKQVNLGVPNSLNVILSVHKEKKLYVKKVIGSTISIIFFLLILLYSFLFIFEIELGKKFDFKEYRSFIFIIICFSYFNSIFAIIYRVYGKIREIIIEQSLVPLSLFLCLLFCKSQSLIDALLNAYVVATIIPFIFYIIYSPVPLEISFNSALVKKLFKQGVYLFIYNASFYLILITTRSIISSSYSISEFGLFTFSFNIANAVTLLLQSFSFLIFPKIINRFSVLDSNSAKVLLEKIQINYTGFAHFLTSIVIFIIPFVIDFLPEYKNSVNSFRMIAMTVVIYSNTFGYSSILISKQKEKQLALIGITVLTTNIFFVSVLSEIWKISFSFTLVGTIVANFLFMILLTVKGQKEIDSFVNITKAFLSSFPLRLLLPFGLNLGFTLLQLPKLSFIIPLILFISLNTYTLKSIGKLIVTVISKPNYTDF